MLRESGPQALQPILSLVFDTWMRKEEVLALRWEQVDLEASTIALAPEDTKTDEPRLSSSRAERRMRSAPCPRGSRRRASSS